MRMVLSILILQFSSYSMNVLRDCCRLSDKFLYFTARVARSVSKNHQNLEFLVCCKRELGAEEGKQIVTKENISHTKQVRCGPLKCELVFQ